MIYERNNVVWYNGKGGYAVLLSVLVAGAIGVAAVVSLILLGISSSRTGRAVQQSAEARALADACAEEALQRIRDATSYTGTGGLSLGNGSCTFTVTSQGGQNRIITSSGTVGSVTRKVRISINKINPAIQIVSWQEVADF